MKHIIQAAGLAAFALASSAFTSQAHADFRVRLDNYSNPTKLDWAKTGSTVTVQCQTVTNGNWTQVGTPRALTGITGSNDFVIHDITAVAELVTKIRVLISNDDMFFIDQVELFGIDPTGLTPEKLVSTWGFDDMTGWCVSSDTTDHASQCVGTNATTSKTFIR